MSTSRIQADQKILKAIQQIETLVLSPEKGIPEALFLFISRLTPLVNVDLLIRNEQEQMLLTWRSDAIFGQGWHLPGGCVRIGESFADRIAAVAANELGTGVTFAPTPLAVYETVDRTRPARTHHVSLLFDCKLTGQPRGYQKHTDKPPEAGAWAWHSSCPDDFLQADYRRLFRSSSGS